MDVIDLSSLFTVLAFVSFIGIVWWAWSSRREDSFSQAARIPMDDDDRPAAPRATVTKRNER
jgi:cytochrome c oxidase cbb3-type subunit 4